MLKNSYAMLPAFSVIAVSGRDARTFLQGQLTNDLLGLERHPGLLAAACNREGRVLEVLRLAAHGETVLIVVRRTLAQALITRLARFILRAEVTLDDRGESLAVAGLIDPLPGGSWSQAQAGAADITLMVASSRRLLLLGPRAAIESLLRDCDPVGSDHWDRASIEDGEPTVYPETAGDWIPQMLNLDLLAAVSFSKGCYVGQEIVARTQNLGRIKRRMLRFTGPAGTSFAPGQPLYSGEQRAARVVASCAGPGGVELLAVTELQYCSDLLGSGNGDSELVPADLPYSIPAPVTAPEPF